MRQILHVDMDSFYASVEQRDDPSLKGRPVIVGGPSKRGVVCAASYEVRPFGVRSAMPMADALRRCPHAVVIAPRMAHYAEVSHQLFDIFSRYTPLCEGLSLDEAFLDVTASRALFGDGIAIAGAIREAIRGELLLTASAGVATNKLIAKIASDLNKPDGLVAVAAGDERAFLAPLAVERMWGVGPKAAAALHGVGIRTIGDLASAHPRAVAASLGSRWGEVIVRLARGEDERDVHPDRAAVSMGAEETFEDDVRTVEAALDRLLAQTERVVRRLTAHRLTARVVVIKVKYAERQPQSGLRSSLGPTPGGPSSELAPRSDGWPRRFKLVTRRMTVDEPLCDTVSIYAVVRELVKSVEIDGRRVRLTGVSLGGLEDRGSGTAPLFPDTSRQRREQLEQTLQEVRRRFGDDSVGRGRGGKR